MSYPPHWIPRHGVSRAFPRCGSRRISARRSLNSVVIACGSVALALCDRRAAAAYARCAVGVPRRNPRTALFLLMTQMLAPVLLILGLFRMAAAIPFGDGTLVNTRVGVILIYARVPDRLLRLDAVRLFRRHPARISRKLPGSMAADACRRSGTCSCRLRCRRLPSAPGGVRCGMERICRGADHAARSRQADRHIAGGEPGLRALSVAWNQVMAAALVATLPVAVVFASLQRYLVRGLTLGAVK